MADRIDLAIAEYNRAIDDYTSLGRWAWGLAIAFGTSVLFNSAGGKQVIETPERVRQSIYLVALAVVVLVFFVLRARRRVTRGRHTLNSVEMYADPRAVWVLGGGVRDNAGWCVLIFRLIPAALVLVTYWLMIDDVVCVAQSANEWWGDFFGRTLCHWLPKQTPPIDNVIALL